MKFSDEKIPCNNDDVDDGNNNDGKVKISSPCTVNSLPKENLQVYSPDVRKNKKYQDDFNKHQSHCDCGISGLGIIQKISYHDQTLNPVDIQFSSACIRCGLCLVIADKINKTLTDVHDAMSSDRWLDDKEVQVLFKMICDQSFSRYRLREIDKERYIGEGLPGSIIVESTANGLWAKNLKIKCNELLEGITIQKLYKQWQEYHDNNENKNLATILCNGDIGILRDCRSIVNVGYYPKSEEPFHAGVKVKAAFNCI
ncbi:hypothetical protein PV328_002877 [Microctonus aethiopoides]|uniref:Uncharacterized protein n=1 Tax=Microctonus aethiopoides TaxID=144406 RepID=A0AA39F789_9HYME|nr:hypothetical protein PV328_002877 [Microctonus aethiopoides]